MVTKNMRGRIYSVCLNWEVEEEAAPVMARGNTSLQQPGTATGSTVVRYLRFALNTQKGSHFMRNLELPGRSAVLAANGMAATSHPLATITAVSVLQAGGNAMDRGRAHGGIYPAI